MRTLSAITYLAAGIAFGISLGGAARGEAFSPDAPALVRHRIWFMTCTPNEGEPYDVGWDARDQTIQIKSPNGRPFTYRGKVTQITPDAFVVMASRSDQRRLLVITFQGANSSVHAVGVNSDGSAGGIDSCIVQGGRD
jgi:hypothetical protein